MNTIHRTPSRAAAAAAAAVALAVSPATAPFAGSTEPPAGFPGSPAGSSLTTATMSSGGELSQIPYLDLAAYQGTWHQVAVLPHAFSLQCARDTTAQYTITGADTVRVVNSCTDWFGNPSGIEGAGEGHRSGDAGFALRLVQRCAVPEPERADQLPGDVDVRRRRDRARGQPGADRRVRALP
ncbi:lipocalin family protein [Corynebacterium sp. TAE3-ERU16]|nr:lipocalin family protein [Corynebacterium sp. TAE3-ERU16]